MRNTIVLIATLTMSAAVTGTAALAVTCQEHYAVCASRSKAETVSQCAKARAACVASCRGKKQGVFIGPMTGRPFPADCR